MMDIGVVSFHQQPTSLVTKTVESLQDSLKINCNIPIDPPEYIEEFQGDVKYRLNWNDEQSSDSVCRTIDCYKVAFELGMLSDIIKNKCGLAIAIETFSEKISKAESRLAVEIQSTMAPLASKCEAATKSSRDNGFDAGNQIIMMKEIGHEIKLLKENIEKKCDAAIEIGAAFIKKRDSLSIKKIFMGLWDANSTTMQKIIADDKFNYSSILESNEQNSSAAILNIKTLKKRVVCQGNMDSLEESQPHNQTIMIVNELEIKSLWTLTDLGFNLGGLVGALTLPIWANKLGRYHSLIMIIFGQIGRF